MGKDKNNFDEFLKWAIVELRLRRAGYRKVKKQVYKRINSRMKILHLKSYDDYKEYIEGNSAEWDVLDKMMQISISRFFRDIKTWELLGDKLLPERAARAAKESRPFYCWSIGCASGEEPYSLAILYHQKLKHLYPNLDFQIIATDANTHLLERAVKACYPAGNVKDVPGKWLETYFFHKNGMYFLKDTAKSMVDFYNQDIRKEMPGGRFDIVFCKNIVGMYYSTEYATEIYNRIAEKIYPGGFLITGNHEPLPIDSLPEMKVFNKGLNIWQKIY